MGNSNFTASYTASNVSGGQTGSVATTTGSSVYELSTGGTANVTEDNRNAAAAMSNIFESSAQTLAQISSAAAQSAGAAAQNPNLISPVPVAGTSNVWVEVGAVVAALTLLYLVWRGR